jgi:hypothetical protein
MTEDPRYNKLPSIRPYSNPTTKVFDPRVIQEDSNLKLWSTASIILADNGLREGYKLIESPYNSLIKDARLRKANLAFKYSTEELDVINSCINDKIFFGNNFISLKDANEGWQRIQLRDYQENLLNRYTQNRWNIIMFPRQSGKTTTTIIEIVYFLTFNIDKDCVVIAQSEKTVQEILAKIKQAFHSMPFFMMPGFVSFTKKSVHLDNGCRLSIGVASESVVQGYSLDLLYIDEFAYIRDNVVGKFWNNIYPTLINNMKSRCIITSTPNGRNQFHTLWVNAINGINTFSPYRIYWTDVPRIQSHEEFKNETIKNVGHEGWEMGFECSFDVSLKTIFTTSAQKMLRQFQDAGKDHWSNELHPICDIHDSFEFVDNIEFDTKNDYFIFSIDIAEGLGQNYSVIKINKVDWDTQLHELIYRQVGVFHDNEISEEDLAVVFMDTVKYFDQSKITVLVESNTYGALFFHEFDSRRNYDKMYSNLTKQIFAKFWRVSKNDYDYGLYIREENKKIGVKAFTKIVKQQTFITTHFNTIEEYLNFGRQNNGTYSANYGNDDLVMTDTLLAYYLIIQNDYAKVFLNKCTENLRERYMDLSTEQKQRILQAEIDKNKNYFYIENKKYHVRDHQKELEKLEKSKSNIYV